MILGIQGLNTNYKWRDYIWVAFPIIPDPCHASSWSLRRLFGRRWFLRITRRLHQTLVRRSPNDDSWKYEYQHNWYCTWSTYSCRAKLRTNASRYVVKSSHDLTSLLIESGSFFSQCRTQHGQRPSSRMKCWFTVMRISCEGIAPFMTAFSYCHMFHRDGFKEYVL